MNLDRYVADLRAQLAASAQAEGDDVRTVAERLSTALEPATRLVLLEVLSDAAGEITRELAPTSVDVRLRGRDPELVVSLATPPDEASAPAAPVVPAAAAAAEPADDVVDGSTSRTTLRLPDHLKARAERAAVQEGVSVNTWLVRVVAAALEAPAPRASLTAPGTTSFTGWVR